ncbi:MAG: hypothetical protein E3J72_00475 [Planctomycetota bacterium]|nr:MAG: hypothetical protein E3J72_00475 [Planctomycetota bacterium]
MFNSSGHRVGVTGPGFYGRGLPGLVHWSGNGAAGADILLQIGGYHGPIHRVPWCEMYFADNNSWIEVADMNRPRGHLRFACKITKDDLVFVPAGWDDTNHPQNTAELYDRTTDTWTLCADTLTEMRGGHITDEMPNGHYFIIGLGSGAEFYDHSTGLFTWAGLVYGPGREQFNHTQLDDGSFMYVGGAGKVVEKLVP